MKLFTLEHSKTAYQADVVFYGVAVAAGTPRTTSARRR